ncbi:TPA: hypothetical protein JIY97_00540 [Acinetobacter baumannii]|nr:hypothetical protein [Acinetobacter baumannii]
MNEINLSSEYGYVSHSDIVDPYYHTKLIDDWEFSYNQVSSGKFTGNLNKFWLDGIEIYEEKLTTCIFQEGSNKNNILCLGIFRNIENPVLWMGDTVGQNDIISIHPNKEIMIKTPKESVFYALQIPVNLLLDEELEVMNNEIYSINNNILSSRMYAKFFNIFENLEKTTSIINKNTKKYIKSELIDIGCDYINITQKEKPHNSYSKEKARKVINEIINYLNFNKDSPITVEDCCQLTYTSRRTLQNYFELVVGCSPSLFLKYWRLNGVRKMILNDKCNMNIGDIASYWGFWHLSQFSSDYKRLFGETPSQTLLSTKK